MLDIIFLSYNETNADQNWTILTKKFPRSQRVHGIDGVIQAHMTAAQMSRSEFFFIVDGDNKILPEFDPNILFEPHPSTVYVWRAHNPVNDLCYGYGGIKLYNRSLFAKLALSSTEKIVDLATSIAVNYKPVTQVASITCFNASPLEAWRGGFREAVKLTLNVLRNPKDQQSLHRLDVWCSQGSGRLNGDWAIRGAQQGELFARKEWAKSNTQNLSLAIINNFQFLNSLFGCQNTESRI